MIARVRGVFAGLILDGSIVIVRGSMSTNTGVAPVKEIATTVATAACETVITSSPGPLRRPTTTSAAHLSHAYTNAQTHADVSSKLGLEFVHFIDQNVLAVREGLLDGAVNFSPIGSVSWCWVGLWDKQSFGHEGSAIKQFISWFRYSQ